MATEQLHERALPRESRVRLERPTALREREFLDAVRRSRVLHGSFVEPPSTTEEYREYLRRQRRSTQECFLVAEAAARELVGVINVNDIVRGSFQSASLGYYAFVPHAGSGLMQEALRVVVSWCFRDLGLHRLEANIQPTNVRSIGLVTSLGFQLEGTSRRYLKIRGRWRDHQRWALLAEEWRVLEPVAKRRLQRRADGSPGAPRVTVRRRAGGGVSGSAGGVVSVGEAEPVVTRAVAEPAPRAARARPRPAARRAP